MPLPPRMGKPNLRGGICRNSTHWKTYAVNANASPGPAQGPNRNETLEGTRKADTAVLKTTHPEICALAPRSRNLTERLGNKTKSRSSKARTPKHRPSGVHRSTHVAAISIMTDATSACALRASATVVKNAFETVRLESSIVLGRGTSQRSRLCGAATNDMR